MTMEYVLPPTARYKSVAREVYCTSDVHLGNTRWTNDLHKQNNSPNFNGFLTFLGEVAATVAQAAQPGNVNLNVLDLVLHGDIFDFWKAVPNPLFGEDQFHLHTEEDYVQRFREILAYNEEVLWQLCLILYHFELKVGAHVYILPGNHDAAPGQIIPNRLRPMLLDALVRAADTGNLIPPTGQQAYRAALDGQLHWGKEEVYDNTELLLHIQHGHRWDNANLPRREDNIDMLAEGHILVESFLNGLHDINLSTFQPAWEHVRTVMARKPAPHNINLAELGRRMDNFDSELGAADYLRAVISMHGGEVDTLMRNTTSATFWQMDWKVLSALASLPIIADIGELFAKLGSALRRSMFSPMLQDEGNRILDGAYSQVWPTVPKVVVMGHTHIFDEDPPTSASSTSSMAPPTEGTRQYINSGTWVDVLHYDSSNPQAPRALPYDRPVHCKLIMLPGPFNEVAVRDNGHWLVHRRVKLY
jgi:hypothetical protein